MYEKQVEVLVANLNRAKANLLSARSKTPHSVLTWMETSLLPYLKKQTSIAESQYKRILSVLLNSSQSFFEGLAQGEATLEEAFELGKDFKKAIALIEFEKDQADKKLSQEQKQIDQDIGRDGLFKMSQESQPTIMKYSIYAKDLPRSLHSTLFTIKRMPVVPITDPQLNFEKLKKAKLATDHIAYYPILLNQPVIGFNQDWVHGEFKGKLDEAIKYVIDSIKSKFNRTHIVLGRANHVGNVSWVWAPSERDLNRIHALAPGGRLKISKWGFAFNV